LWWNREVGVFLGTLLMALVALGFPRGVRAVVEVTSGAAAYPADQALALGKAIYREGRLPDGTEVEATFGSGVKIPGPAAACANCHKRSGLGSVEGSQIVWPVNAGSLFSPRRTTGAWRASARDKGPGSPSRWQLPARFDSPVARPAYTDETLARMIRTGVDASGRHVSAAMPRYALDDDAMALLLAYLRQLSPDKVFSPGVDDKSIRFAVVVDARVPAEKSAAMLDVLNAVTASHNTQTRPHLRRAAKGPFYKTEAYGAYRRIELVVWKLEGEEEGWRAQLEAYLKREPVFALLGGISTSTWQPIHRFCEDHEIPAILPLTDEPVVSDNDWYTLYFSRGSYQEGEIAARYLARQMETSGRGLFQVYREGTTGKSSAAGFSDAWKSVGQQPARELVIPGDSGLSATQWRKLLQEAGESLLLMWLEGEDLVQAMSVLDALHKEGWQADVLVSSQAFSQMEKTLSPQLRKNLTVVSTHSPPGEFPARERVLERWLAVQSISYTNREIQAKMYFLGWLLPGVFKHMRGEYYRDYFMEGFEMMGDQYHAIAVYPRLSFSPGQRYLAHGGYILQLAPGSGSGYRKVVDWQDGY